MKLLRLLAIFILLIGWHQKKCTINPQNKNYNSCFLCANHSCPELSTNNYYPEIISKIKPVINNFNWKELNFPPQQEDYKNLKPIMNQLH